MMLGWLIGWLGCCKNLDSNGSFGNFDSKISVVRMALRATQPIVSTASLDQAPGATSVLVFSMSLSLIAILKIHIASNLQLLPAEILFCALRDLKQVGICGRMWPMWTLSLYEQPLLLK